MHLILAVSLSTALGSTLDTPKLARLLGLPASERPVVEVARPPANPPPWRLLGTLCSSKSISLAAIDDGKRVLTLAPGDQHQQYEVIDVTPRAIQLRSADGVVWLGMLAIAPSSSGSPVPNGVPRVSRQMFTELMNDPSQLMRQAHFLPTRAGDAMSLKATWVDPQSLLGTLGLKTGDVLKKVNGRVVRTPEDALALYGALRGWSHFDVEIDRGGTTVQLQLGLSDR